MTPSQWTGLASGVLLAGALLALARQGLRGGGLVRQETRRFVCPKLGQGVACTLERDLRTGQFGRVRSCSAFSDPEDVRCDVECAARLNLGLALPGEQERP